jgi:hypothetical protein
VFSFLHSLSPPFSFSLWSRLSPGCLFFFVLAYFILIPGRTSLFFSLLVEWPKEFGALKLVSHRDGMEDIASVEQLTPVPIEIPRMEPEEYVHGLRWIRS